MNTGESLRNPLIGSAVFHAAVAALFILLSTTLNRNRETWGDLHPTPGTSVAISPVSTIPLPARKGPKNPVANDTESVTPPAVREKVAKTRVEEPDPDAVALKTKKKHKPSKKVTTVQRYVPPEIPRPNQVRSSQAPAAVSPLFEKRGGPGAVGLDANSVLGSRFGAYAMLLMQRVSEKWVTSGLQNVHTPFAIVSVDLFRDGSIRNTKLVQTSGNYLLDTTAQRAVLEAAPFPPLPADYERNMVNVEFKFQIKQ